MTPTETRAVQTLISFLLGPPDNLEQAMEKFGGAGEVSPARAIGSIEYLISRYSDKAFVDTHEPGELREKWNARFGQPEGATQITAEERLNKEGRLKKRDTAWQAFDACLELSFAQARTDKVGK